MFKKIVTVAIAVVLIVGCEPIFHTDPLPPDSGGFYVSSNAYHNDITVDSYEINYQDGVFSKEFKNYDGGVIPSGFGLTDRELYRVGHYKYKYYERYPKEEHFNSFLTIFYLDSNRTYTVAGFTEEMDREYNLTEGKRADIYGIGYLKGDKIYFKYSNATIVDITQTGEFTFTAGE